MRQSTLLWTIVTSLLLIGHVGFVTYAQEDDAADDVADDVGGNDVDAGNATGVAICFQCNSTDDCAVEQEAGNSTVQECEAGQHCWVSWFNIVGILGWIMVKYTNSIPWVLGATLV
uniref:uncharacterized protein LOC104266493 n=1 Tax=Ciona intestinalis TaxID=7719 RepID=UPI000EF54B7C|nr:uncharacterized protein LOC104266493 [Ciona intestinalis]|eukprot:XP_026693847.1 uncharacterized protein LOC104266493 [Ciona intestinalis]